MKERIVVGTVVYKQALEYLTDFLDSLVEQTSQDFDVMILNDNVSFVELKSVVMKYPKIFQKKILLIDKLEKQLEPYVLRIELFKEAFTRNYDLLVIMDCDDKASKNRVECIQQQFESQYTFFYNELRNFEGEMVMPELPRYTLSNQAISECNYLGMSNTTLYLKKLSLDWIESLKEGRTSIFDWYLFARLLLSQATGKKILDAYTYYRIYDQNIAGRNTYSKELLEREVSIKIEHYKLLSGYGDYYKHLLEKYENLDIQHIVIQPENGYWWSLIDSSRQK